jgi:hypothetical protein
MENSKKIVSDITDYVNSFGDVHTEFIQNMRSEHRTLQQSFTRLCLKWIEFVGSDEYSFDMRNQQSHEICFLLLKLFKENQGLKYTGSTLEIMSKPSGHLSKI